MTNTSERTSSLLLQARVAGMLYLLIIIFGISSEVFIRGNLIDPNDAAATAANIATSQTLFRAGFLADSIMLLCDVAIAVLFYTLLKSINKTLAITAAAFRLIQASILGLNLLNYYAVVLLLSGTGAGTLLETKQLHAQVMLFLDMHSHGYDLGLLFFAISNFILGYLIIRSTFLPTILGYGLQAAATVYLIGSYTRFMAPDYIPFVEPFYLIPLVAELSFCLWLLIKGIKVRE